MLAEIVTNESTNDANPSNKNVLSSTFECAHIGQFIVHLMHQRVYIFTIYIYSKAYAKRNRSFHKKICWFYIERRHIDCLLVEVYYIYLGQIVLELTNCDDHDQCQFQFNIGRKSIISINVNHRIMMAQLIPFSYLSIFLISLQRKSNHVFKSVYTN